MAKVICVFKQCKNKQFKGGLCKKHYPGDELMIYAGGQRIDEPSIYDGVRVGSLTDEIRLAKLQLRRVYMAQREYEKLPADAQNMVVASINVTGGWLRDGKVVDAVGTLVQSMRVSKRKKGEAILENTALVDTEVKLIRPDFAVEIERLLNIIMRLEKTHHELTGGVGDNPNDLAQQIIDSISAIEDNANSR